jgi:hypothetical protein
LRPLLQLHLHLLLLLQRVQPPCQLGPRWGLFEKALIFQPLGRAARRLPELQVGLVASHSRRSASVSERVRIQPARLQAAARPRAPARSPP